MRTRWLMQLAVLIGLTFALADLRAGEGEKTKTDGKKPYTRAGLMGLQAGTEPSRKVVLRFRPDSAGAAESAPFMSDQKIEREASGHLRVTFKTNALFQLRRELMRWAAEVEVLEPAELRNEIKASVKEMFALYK